MEPAGRCISVSQDGFAVGSQKLSRLPGLGLVPRPRCQHPAPQGQSLADAAMSSWGGVSWQVPDLPGAVAGACHGPGPGASVISLLALSPCKEAALPAS